MTTLWPTAVYSLCLVTSFVCAGLLARAYQRSRSKLLLWSAVSFGFLALNNLLLVADLLILPTVDLWVWRQLAAAIAVSLLIYGFIWEVE